MALQMRYISFWSWSSETDVYSMVFGDICSVSQNYEIWPNSVQQPASSLVVCQGRGHWRSRLLPISTSCQDMHVLHACVTLAAVLLLLIEPDTLLQRRAKSRFFRTVIYWCQVQNFSLRQWPLRTICPLKLCNSLPFFNHSWVFLLFCCFFFQTGTNGLNTSLVLAANPCFPAFI